MSIVNLASGGLDSTLVSVLTREEGLQLHRCSWTTAREQRALSGRHAAESTPISDFRVPRAWTSPDSGA